RLLGDGDVGGDLLVGLDDVVRVLVAGGIAPPGQTERGGSVLAGPAATAGGVRTACGQSGESGDGESEGEGLPSCEHRISCDLRVQRERDDESERPRGTSPRLVRSGGTALCGRSAVQSFIRSSGVSGARRPSPGSTTRRYPQESA